MGVRRYTSLNEPFAWPRSVGGFGMQPHASSRGPHNAKDSFIPFHR